MDNAKMIEQLKLQLGGSGIDLELEDGDFTKCIEAAILMAQDHIQVRRYKTYAVARPKESDIIPHYSFCVDLSDLEFEIVTEVYRSDMIAPYLFDQFYLINYASRGVPSSLAIAMNMRSNVEALVNRSWKVVDKKLFLDKYYTGVTVEFIPKVVGLDDIEDSYWIGWIMRYALAVAKESLARIRGKLVVDSNPYKTDADTLAQEASTEKKDLLDEIAGRGFLDVRR